MSKKILILHAYSRHNHGDGLLVDLTIDAIQSACGDSAQISILCLDKNSFQDLDNCLEHPIFANTGISKVFVSIKFAVKFLTGQMQLKDLTGLQTTCDFDAIVAVGGGYLRTTSCFQGIKAILAHAVQIQAVRNSKIKSIYLPQSIGPFHPVFAPLFYRSLRYIDRIYVRDDRSFSELQKASVSCKRTSDLAVFEIAKRISGLDLSARGKENGVAIIARNLAKSTPVRNLYIERLQNIFEAIEGAFPAVQSKGHGNNDPEFYRSIGWGDDHPSFSSIIKSKKPQVAVSVRLHGALEAISEGIPTVHLSYERKGFAAFNDLGIQEFVHNVYNFDPDKVIAQVNQLREDPEIYWAAIRKSSKPISIKYHEMVDDLTVILEESPT